MLELELELWTVGWGCGLLLLLLWAVDGGGGGGGVMCPVDDPKGVIVLCRVERLGELVEG